jgi:cytosine/adenosine deaminase-related metal-dependent hydrolase
MIDSGVRVGLGVDGSASNDGGDLLGEARQAMLLQRVGHGPSSLSARAALELATRGGAGVLGRDDIGRIEPGCAADIVAFDLDAIGYAGQHDPVAALLFCAPSRAAWSMIDGASSSRTDGSRRSTWRPWRAISARWRSSCCATIARRVDGSRMKLGDRRSGSPTPAS